MIERTRRGRALYDKRWPEIEKASDDQVSMGGLTAFAAQIGADRETIQSLAEGVFEAAGLSWKYRTRTVTDLLDWLYLGTLKGYLFRPGHIPAVQPKGSWNDPKLLHGLLAGYVYEGNPKQQRKAYIIVREDELAEALEADQPGAATEEAETSGEPARVPLPRAVGNKAAVGRPSRRDEIKSAYEELAAGGEIDFDGPKTATYEPIRRRVGRSSSNNFTGLGDEAIRNVITPLFDREKAAKHRSCKFSRKL